MTSRNKFMFWLIAVSIVQEGAAWPAYAADIQMQVQAAPTTQGSPSPTGKLHGVGNGYERAPKRSRTTDKDQNFGRDGR